MPAMRYLADLHVHSRFSRAVSRSLDLTALASSAQRKGLTVLGTGDFTHPAWRAELTEGLVPAEPGLYRLRDELAAAATEDVPPSCRRPVRFVLQTEISTIYKAGGRARKVHHVILAPSLESAGTLSEALEAIGNVASDGRPILGLDSRDLLEIVLERCPGGCLIPAHVWTPWFSALGSKSGFDSIDECYRDLAPEIFAVETGLSSDPEMNWRVSSLDRFALVSNSDAHSAAKLARECNAFDAPLSYDGMVGALRGGDPDRFLGTVEFFPEEGKYHLDGHRKCRARLSPDETRSLGELCPVCGKKVTVGVLSRVTALADREEGETPDRRLPSFRRLIGLAETVGRAFGCGPQTKRVQRLSAELFARVGSELEILQDADLGEIERVAGSLVAEAIRRVRHEEIRWEAGYDGEFGIFEIFSPGERDVLSRQLLFFAPEPETAGAEPAGGRAGALGPCEVVDDDPWQTGPRAAERVEAPREGDDPLLSGLGPEQLAAVLAPPDRPLLVVAGPGTGKTRTLTTRIAHRIREGGLEPSAVVALTFTNRAAEELRERLGALLGRRGESVQAMTFHAFGLRVLRESRRWRPRIAEESERLEHVRSALGAEASRAEATKALASISLHKSAARGGDDVDDTVAAILDGYDASLREAGAFDLDDLVLRAAEALEAGEAETLRSSIGALFVDEYQDLSPGQVRLLKALVQPSTELTAIGDPDQAIYGFRGADSTGIVEFEKDWPGARALSLGRSYRSSAVILAAASEVIAAAEGRSRARLWSEVEGAPAIVTIVADNERSEAERIALSIERLLGGTSLLSFDSGLVESAAVASCETFSDVAVLYRLRSQAEPLAEALDRLGLPCSASTRPLEAEPVVDEVLRALRVAAGRESTADRAAVEGALAEDDLESLRRAAVGAPADAILEMVVRAAGVDEVEHADALGPLRRIARSIAATAAVPRPLDRESRPVDRLLDWVALHREQDLADPRADRISLVTLHASKGLEWKVVFLAGCEDGLMPYRRPGSEPDLDEERRLFFVGMTRAERLLVLSRARERFLHGSRATTRPSPFLHDIDPSRLHADDTAPKKSRPKARQLGLF